MQKDSGIRLKTLKVDGGAVRNNYLMQFQSDLLQTPVERGKINETTAPGRGVVSGLGRGILEKPAGSAWQGCSWITV